MSGDVGGSGDGWGAPYEAEDPRGPGSPPILTAPAQGQLLTRNGRRLAQQGPPRGSSPHAPPPPQVVICSSLKCNQEISSAAPAAAPRVLPALQVPPSFGLSRNLETEPELYGNIWHCHQSRTASTERDHAPLPPSAPYF